jgi:hypothetical protein
MIFAAFMKQSPECQTRDGSGITGFDSKLYVRSTVWLPYRSPTAAANSCGPPCKRDFINISIKDYPGLCCPAFSGLDLLTPIMELQRKTWPKAAVSKPESRFGSESEFPDSAMMKAAGSCRSNPPGSANPFIRKYKGKHDGNNCFRDRYNCICD